MEQTTTERIAGQVRAILAQRRLTRRWLADQVGMPVSTLNRRLTGSQAFTVDELAAVAAALDIATVSLFPADDPGAAVPGHMTTEVA